MNNIIQKKNKFKEIKKIESVFNKEKNSICLIAHINNMNTMEINILKEYLDTNKINHFSFKLNLLKKYTKNTVFTNLCSGPTKFYFFSDFNTFNTFFENVPISQKILPLSIYYKNQFYSFSFFKNRFKEIYNIDSDKNITVEQQFILNLTLNTKSFIHNLNNNTLRMISTLSVLKNKIENK